VNSIPIILVTLIPVAPITPITLILTSVRHDITAAQSDCQQTQNQYQFFHDASLIEALGCSAIGPMPAVVVVATDVLTVIAFSIIATVIPPIIPPIAPLFIASNLLTFLVTRDVLLSVPVVLHKVDPFVAGVVLTTVFTPVLCVSGRYVQVDRRAVHRCSIHDARLLVDQSGSLEVSDVDVTIEARLANAER